MQLFNSSSAKKIFTHTWYIYPIGALLLSLIWIWAFPTYHQPTKHQTISIFFAAEVKDDSFLKNIQSNYEREKLREVTPSYCMPDATVFGQKMKIANSYADILVINETVFKRYESQYSDLFAEIDSNMKENYFKDNSYYTSSGKDYAVLLKSKDVTSKLEDYLLMENENYYLCFAVGSNNLGKSNSPENEYYDNALTFAQYLLEI